MNEVSGRCLVDDKGAGSAMSSSIRAGLVDGEEAGMMLSSRSIILGLSAPGGSGGLVVGLLFLLLLGRVRASGGDEPGSGEGNQESSLPLLVESASGNS